MALTDIVNGVRRLARPLALGLAVGGCGEAEPGSGGESKCVGTAGICSCYEEHCGDIFSAEHQQECDTYCTPERIQNWQQGDDCLGMYCMLQEHFCPTPEIPKADRDPIVLSCMESYGWIQCKQDYNCKVDWGEQCINNRCK